MSKIVQRAVCLISAVFMLVSPAVAQDAPQDATPSGGMRYVLSDGWESSGLKGPDRSKPTYYTRKVGATATVYPAFPGPTRAKVYVYKLFHATSTDRNVTVEVKFGERTDTRSLDYGKGKSEWVELGIFQFEGTDDEYVRTTRTSKTGYTRSGAVRYDVLADGSDSIVLQTFTLDEPTSQAAATNLIDLSEPAQREGPPAGENAEWTVTFSDDFDGAALDWEKWQSSNSPSTHIISGRYPENAEVKDGRLRLLTKKEERGGQQWTSGNVWTKHFTQQYGYFEARIKIGDASGLNNAFWLMTRKKPSDPIHFEIDIIEAHYPNRISTTLHNWSGEHKGSGKIIRTEQDLSDDFHNYGLLWDEEKIVWYVDGIEVRREANRFCHLDAPVRFSTAVATMGGKITDATGGTVMEIDWFRVHQRTEPATRPATPQ